MWGGQYKSTNKPVAAHANFDDDVHPDQVHLLITALDYKQTGNPLTCTVDAKNMKDLAQACGINNVTEMYDLQCTKQNVEAAIRQIGARMSDDDFFVYYYSGHGTSMPDRSGDEVDGMDECFCFVDPQGQISANSVMVDDDFARIVTEAIPESCRVLILTDCCHSGTIADLDHAEWSGRQVITIAGCTDQQTSGDMGKGGIFTHSMLLAIDKLQKSSGDHVYSAGLLYNAAVKEDDAVFQSEQDITLKCVSGFAPDKMPWPLVPQREYAAPLRKAAGQAASGAIPVPAPAAGHPAGSTGQLQAVAQTNPDVIAQLGISPAILQHLSGLEDSLEDVDENYMEQLVPGALCDACSIM